jgi:cysteinyl-tRNA synthetase
LNTPKAISVLLANSEHLAGRLIAELLDKLGIDLASFEKQSGVARDLLKALNPEVDDLVAARDIARKARNWAASDRIRNQLADMGYDVLDNKDGTSRLEVKR